MPKSKEPPKGTPQEMLFGSGCQAVNCEKLAPIIRAAPTTLRRWRDGNFPEAFYQLAAICRIRELKDEDIGKLVRQFK